MIDPRTPLAQAVGRLARHARLAIGWSQEDLSDRAEVPQSALSRLERGLHSGLDFEDLERIGQALGGRWQIDLAVPFLADRKRQRDRVHARVIGYIARRLSRAGWEVATEVEIRSRLGSGWIDVLAWHVSSRTLLVIEVKTEIHDLGRIQRTLAWYERGSWRAARERGWTPTRIVGALVLLDTAVVRDRLLENRLLVDQAFPARSTSLAEMVLDPLGVSIRMGRAVATVDPLSRRSGWLRPTALDGRRTPPAYESYADLARRLGR
jgi:transcriptional regulator with XRE-family HTH domain